MKSLVRLAGKVIYWISWPVLAFHINGSKRTRLLVTNGNEFLAVKGWVSDGRWGLPGGGVHKNEEPIEALIREVKEETGHRPGPRIN